MMQQTTPRSRDKREAILDAAARLFNEQGVRGALMSDVAAAVGLANTSLTYYYRRKEDLVAACMRRSIAALAESAAFAAASPRLADRIGRFLGHQADQLAEMATGRQPALIGFSDLLALPPPYGPAVLNDYVVMWKAVRRLLDAADAPGLDLASRNARAHLLLSSVYVQAHYVARFEPPAYARSAQRVADLLLNGLAAPGRAASIRDRGRHDRPPLALPAATAPAAAALNGSLDSAQVQYLRAATRLVNDHGYHGASVERIAAELHLTKGSFYHHHETKEDLVAACFERSFAVIRAAQARADALGGSGLDRLGQACVDLLQFQISAEGPLLRVSARTALPESLQRNLLRTLTRLGEQFGTLILDGMADGSVRIIDPSMGAMFVNGLINAAAEHDRWVRGVDAGNVFELFAMPLLAGLGTSPAAMPGRLPDGPLDAARQSTAATVTSARRR